MPGCNCRKCTSSMNERIRKIPRPEPRSKFSGASGSGTAANSGNITTSNAFDLIVGFCENDTNGSLGVTPGAGWTQRELVDGQSVCDQIVSSTGTYAFSATIAGSVSWGAYILAFQAAAAPAPGTGGVVCIMQ